MSTPEESVPNVNKAPIISPLNKDAARQQAEEDAYFNQNVVYNMNDDLDVIAAQDGLPQGGKRKRRTKRRKSLKKKRKTNKRKSLKKRRKTKKRKGG